MPSKRSKRRDDKGKAYAGSQLQLQAYVNRKQFELNTAIVAALPLNYRTASIEWRSPLEADRFAEYMDGRFLDALGLTRLRPELRSFWPRSGPRWDGLARFCEGADVVGYLLAEAKSYPDELLGRGCSAVPDSDPHVLIKHSLPAAAEWAQPQSDAKWLGNLYQYANRLAHVYFLQKQTRLPVWLVNICFTDDPHRRTSRTEWKDALTIIKSDLGFTAKPVPQTVDVFLDADPNARALLGAAPT